MDWRDHGILLTSRRHGETSAIIEVFTESHGRHAGVARGGTSRKIAPILQPGAAKQPINCATAQGDIRALNSELEHVNKQQALDIAAVTPAGALIGFVAGTEKKRFEMLTGEYQQRLEARIAAIKKMQMMPM